MQSQKCNCFVCVCACVCTGKTGETVYLESANRKIKTEIFSSVNARHRPNNGAQTEGDRGAGAGNS